MYHTNATAATASASATPECRRCGELHNSINTRLSVEEEGHAVPTCSPDSHHQLGRRACCVCVCAVRHTT